MEILFQYGWNSFFSSHLNKNKQNIDPDWKTGRITAVKGTKFHLITERGELEAELAGRVLYGTDPEGLPCTGDWIYYLDYENQGFIVEVYPRMNKLSRKNPGKRTERQVMAANVDYGLIIQGLDRDFNVMRLERYIVQITGCGIQPVVILNKEDLISDRQLYLEQISTLGRNLPVHFCSTITGKGIDTLYADMLEPQKTYILIGSSGAGKSSLINRLSAADNIRTGSVSSSTGKGRHTTTNRELFRLDNGSLIIDTPGMREFGLAADESDPRKGLFPAIEGLEDKCRFSDCTHTEESGCAVVQAVKDGILDRKTYESYLKLVREQRFFNAREAERRRIDKQFGKMTKEVLNFKKKHDL